MRAIQILHVHEHSVKLHIRNIYVSEHGKVRHRVRKCDRHIVKLHIGEVRVPEHSVKLHIRKVSVPEQIVNICIGIGTLAGAWAIASRAPRRGGDRTGDQTSSASISYCLLKAVHERSRQDFPDSWPPSARMSREEAPMRDAPGHAVK